MSEDYKKLVVHMEITVGEMREEDYEGVLEAILEESGHYGDFDVTVKTERVADYDEKFNLISKTAILL